MNSLIEVSSISQNFIRPNGHNQKILDNISFNLKENEILAIVGKSGCGKSTLLKIIANLIHPTKGKIKLNSKIDEKDFAISMIFQSFALFPWLSVMDNVELGLEALNLPEQEKHKQALDAINLIGLDGFESAMPRELSGGMKQRVGFARALVVGAQILLMDEPFSALDVLTADNLKRDFLELWNSKRTPLKSVIIVTRSIEEAVMMADRVLILSSNPCRVSAEINIDLEKPRNSHTVEFQNMVDEIYSQMSSTDKLIAFDKTQQINFTNHLIFASPNKLAAITSALMLTPYKGSGELAELVKALAIETFDVIYIAEALTILKFATVNDGIIKLSKIGKTFAQSELEERKIIFARQLLTNVPLAKYIMNVLNENSNNKAPRSYFQSHLEKHLAHDQAELALKTIIMAGRYAEIFSYDDNTQTFSLDNPEDKYL